MNTLTSTSALLAAECRKDYVRYRQSKFISACKNYGFDVIEVGDAKYDIFKGNKFIDTAFYDMHSNRVRDSYNCVHHLNDYVSKIHSEYN
ncbi:hypothetical protein XNC3_2420022 [Xenorhabdus nematophila F1]|uniref:hypothetical protein n=1 Tax=Xenorhabdus nematophila TaxID=628 RepID=UPI000327563B|nr:hypothetical protein [Xenorhabdus nematophila]CCW31040.1 hypothetical protein XNC3_2420022 [Xenorhabdus nematophila F1]